MSTQSVMVKVVGMQAQLTDGNVLDVVQEDRTELEVSGVYSFQNGKHFVIYEEDDGEGHVTRNTVKIYENSFEVVKRGAVSAHFIFRAGERAESWYDTPYGRFSVALCVTDVRVAIGATELQAEASYMLEMNEEATARCTVCVTAMGVDREEG